MRRVLIITTAACTGFCFAYDADEMTQSTMHIAESIYNSDASYTARGSDGTAMVYDSVEEAINAHNNTYDEDSKVTSLEDLYDFYREDGDGYLMDTAWLESMLSDDSVDFMEYAEHAITE